MVNTQLIPDGEDFDHWADRMERFGNKLIDNFDSVMDWAVDEILHRLQNHTPVDTGKTAMSWTVLSVGLGEFFITNSNEPVITYITQGTAAHRVAPVFAKALHWQDMNMMGQDRFSKGHMVSGIIGLDIEGEVMEEMVPIIDQMIEAAEDAADRASF